MKIHVSPWCAYLISQYKTFILTVREEQLFYKVSDLQVGQGHLKVIKGICASTVMNSLCISLHWWAHCLAVRILFKDLFTLVTGRKLLLGRELSCFDNAPVKVNAAPPPPHIMEICFTIQGTLTTTILSDIILTMQMVEI